jgi:hypothetical protein
MSYSSVSYAVMHIYTIYWKVAACRIILYLWNSELQIHPILKKGTKKTFLHTEYICFLK